MKTSHMLVCESSEHIVMLLDNTKALKLLQWYYNDMLAASLQLRFVKFHNLPQ